MSESLLLNIDKNILEKIIGYLPMNSVGRLCKTNIWLNNWLNNNERIWDNTNKDDWIINNRFSPWLSVVVENTTIVSLGLGRYVIDMKKEKEFRLHNYIEDMCCVGNDRMYIFYETNVNQFNSIINKMFAYYNTSRTYERLQPNAYRISSGIIYKN